MDPKEKKKIKQKNPTTTTIENHKQNLKQNKNTHKTPRLSGWITQLQEKPMKLSLFNL